MFEWGPSSDLQIQICSSAMCACVLSVCQAGRRLSFVFSFAISSLLSLSLLRAICHHRPSSFRFILFSGPDEIWAGLFYRLSFLPSDSLSWYQYLRRVHAPIVKVKLQKTIDAWTGALFFLRSLLVPVCFILVFAI